MKTQGGTPTLKALRRSLLGDSQQLNNDTQVEGQADHSGNGRSAVGPEMIDETLRRRVQEDGLTDLDRRALLELYGELFEHEERRLCLLTNFILNSFNLSASPVRLDFLKHV